MIIPFLIFTNDNVTQMLTIHRATTVCLRCLIPFVLVVTYGLAFASEPCRINVIDASNGWPVPLVELRTTHHIRFVSDNAGVIAFDIPEMMNQETWFDIQGHGYSVAKDGFGFAGIRLRPRPGETLTINVKRALPAKRLGRITGGGLFAESQKLGFEVDWHEQGIVGTDSVLNAVHNGKQFWSWGDTILARYPLGLFHMTGATSELMPLVSYQPPLRLRYDYVVDDKGSPRNVADLPGDGPTWLSGCASLPDKNGVNHLVATYSKIQPPLDAYQCGLCVWNEERLIFEKTLVLWTKTAASPSPTIRPMGHPVFWTDELGKEWILFGDPFPALRCPASFEDWSNPKTWEAMRPQSSVLSRLQDEQVIPHRGSIAWNAYRQKWVAIFTQLNGKPSLLGEIWYAESEAPTGPWKDAVKVVTHADYTFYNPKLHPEFTDPKSPILLFEGTYTKTFSGSQQPTPRHDYNQILYRLDLDDPQLIAKD